MCNLLNVLSNDCNYNFFFSCIHVRSEWLLFKSDSWYLVNHVITHFDKFLPNAHILRNYAKTNDRNIEKEKLAVEI